MTPRRTGFSLMEMLIVVAIVALIALLAGPALFSLVPIQRLRGEAQSVAAFMRQARLKAANNQKPVRVTLACPSETENQPNLPNLPNCRLFMQTAKYDWKSADDKVSWPTEPGEMTRYELARQVSQAFDGTRCGAGGNLPGVSWVIFMPNGRTYSCPDPFKVNLQADDVRGGPEGGKGWELEVSNGSGRAALTPINW